MSDLKEVLFNEIESFRDKGHEFLNGDISKMDFKGLSGGMGVYAHRDGKEFMIRLRVPSGILSVQQLQQVYDWIVQYNLGGVHLTTRQAIQYHGMSIDDICDLMKDALGKNIYTRGAGGNFPRNVALSPLAGVDKEEAFDPTPYALAAGAYFLERIYTYKLPRKLKVSFSNSSEDTAHCTIQDLGFLAINENGKEYFKVYLGGGLGKNPKLALILDELIEPKDVLYYIQGMVDLYVAKGNYENKNRARVRYMVEDLGEENFLSEYKKYVSIVKENNDLDLNISTKECAKKGIKIDINNSRVYEQKQEGLYSVYVHPVGGQIRAEELKNILDILKKYEDVDIRLSMTEGIYFRNLNGQEAKEVLEVTKKIGGDTIFDYSVACIGVPTCQMGIGNSQETLKEIFEYFENNNLNKKVMPRVYISGCLNSCGVHEVGSIGFTGKKKRVNDVLEDAFEMHIGGSFEEDKAKLGKAYGDITKKRLPEFLGELSKCIEIANVSFESYIEDREDEFQCLFNKCSC